MLQGMHRPVPSMLSIATMTMVTATSITATYFTASGPVFDARHTTGFVLGVLASGMLLGSTVLRLIRREELKAARRDVGGLHRVSGIWDDPDRTVGIERD